MSLFRKILWGTAPIYISVLIVYFLWKAEPYFLPPISDFVLLDIERRNGEIIIKGTMDKDRDCDLKTVTADGLFENSKIAHSLQIDFSLDDEINLPGTGEHKHWGPWTIVIKQHIGLHNVILKSVHNCIFPWPVVTHLTTMPVNYVYARVIEQIKQNEGSPSFPPDTPAQRELDAHLPKSFPPAYGYVEGDPRRPKK